MWYTRYSSLSCYNGYRKSVWFFRSWFSLKFGFGEYFRYWIKILNDQPSCVINGGFTTPYFNLEKGALQGHPISAYLFLLDLEVLFELIRNNTGIRGITIFNHAFLCTAFEDNLTFFLNELSVKNLIKTFKVFSFSELKANLNKHEITQIGSLNKLRGSLQSAFEQ